MRSLTWIVALGLFGLAQDPAFEVASVKPNLSRSVAGPDGRALGGANITTQGGRFTAQNASLHLLVSLAYGMPEYLISGGPRWMRSDKFNVDAKAPSDASEGATMLMLRSLLADRFQLALHHETTQMPSHVLILAKNGRRPQPLVDRNEDPSARLRYIPLPPAEDGARRFRLRGTASMDQLARFLAASVRGPIVNETGLEGVFDIDVEWASETFTMSLKSSERDASLGVGGGLAPIDSDLASALQTQIGLRFETARRPIQTLVVDRADQPSAN
jgi:uncharacterized protein (TIGR03435 family)